MKITITDAEPVFVFETFESFSELWVDKALFWRDVLIIDSINRPCVRFGHMERARDEGTFPVRVFDLRG